MISNQLAKEVLNIALSTGADFAEIFYEEKQTESLSLDNGVVDTISSDFLCGVGIRILLGLQSVYGYTNDLSKDGLRELATSLSRSFDGKQMVFVTKIAEKKVKNHHPVLRPADAMPKELKIQFLEELHQLMTEDKRIVRTILSLRDSKQHVVIYNSQGEKKKDTRYRTRAYLQAIASENGKIETFGFGPGASQGFEFYSTFDLKEKAKECAKIAVNKLYAQDCPSGPMPVILGNGFGGVIFHEACGHALEASAVSKGLSVFSGKIGKQIASKVVTAIDDGTIVNGWGSGNIDDAGHKTEKTILIKNGILQNYLVDDFHGRRMNTAPNGATRRESYRFEPTSRMSNTYIAAGKSTLEDMLKETSYGLYAKSLGGGSVNPATGDFNFGVEEAYLIENGKIGPMVKGAVLIGNGADVLMRIDMVGNDVKRAQGMCGAASGSIPVDVGQPTIRVERITVGGQGGKK